MRLAHPEWLLIVLLPLAAGWFWRSLHLHKPLRVLCLAFVIFILIEPQIRRQSDGLDLWVLVDRSDSAASLLEPKLSEWEVILQKSKHADDRIRYVDFAGDAVVRGAQITSGVDAEKYDGPRNSTRMASALGYALAQMPPGRAARALVLTDGYSTEPLDGLAERLSNQNVPLDYRLVGQDLIGDYRLASLIVPRRVQLREAFLVEVIVQGKPDATVPVELLRNGQSLGRRDVPVINGVGRLRISDRLGTAGAVKYDAQVLAPNDPIPGNNSATQWVEVQGGPRVLLLTAYENDPLAPVLAAQGFEVETVTDLSTVNVGSLSGTKVVLLNNVPAYKLDDGFLRGLDFFVRHQGGGLAMVGGKYSFAAGGYFGSAVEPLLPVSMELKQEHRKVALALSIVMDRSGSMSMSVPGTNLQKMDLADEGAARAIDLLGDNDFVSVFAVDTEAHSIAPLTAVGKNRGTITNAVRRVKSMGGGIFVYHGLDAAWKELKPSKIGQRHVILFADANDAKEPGDYKKLLEEMQNEKCTVSVIGMGSEQDMDAEFLKDVAKRGGGRIFFNANVNELPSLFAQETVAIARSAFIEEPVAVKGTPGWMEIAATPINWLPQTDGYNLSYLRPGATQAAVSGDDYAAPLVAFWQRGTGRVATVSFPLGGEFSAKTRAWNNYGDLSQSLVRWLMGESLPPGVGLLTALDGSKLKADLFYDDSWNERIAAHAPELVLAQGADGEAKTLPWERLAPGHFRATLDMESSGYVRGAVKIGDAAFPFGPVNAVTNAEWSFDKTRVDELRAVSARSGGGERVDLTDVWNAPRPPAWHGLQRWLLCALVLLLCVEAWQTRTGWKLGAHARTRA